MGINNLWVVMPVYNEEEAIDSVVDEWHQELEKSAIPYTLLILNDGSKDQTLEKLRRFEQKLSRIKIIDKPNSGHGQTCLDGYRLAIQNNADWILQIDSDGQCDPVFLSRFLDLAKTYKAVFGYRKTRDDGFKRSVISRFVTIFTYVATGRWVRDANVPYRLIHTGIMRQIADRVPADFHLANIYVSVLTSKLTKIKWVDIHFRERSGGAPSVKTFSFVKHGFKLFRQLKEAARTK